MADDRAALQTLLVADFLLDPANSDRSFAVTLLRILIAYRTGAMRYGLFTARRS